jgi:hypothetical protein
LLLEHPRARELFPRYLTVSYQLAVGIIHLMEAALARAQALARQDPVAAGLTRYLERHISEEMHGDEPGGGLLEDLAAVGVDPTAVRSMQLSPKLAAAVGADFYWIRHVHPVAILGPLELEAYQASASLVERLIEKTELPREGFRQLLLHAELDLDHASELHRLLDALPLEPRHEQLIGLSALSTMALAIEALLDVVEDAVATQG